MANTILIGAQWGDEGKGKIIDVLTADADIVVRRLRQSTSINHIPAKQNYF